MNSTFADTFFFLAMLNPHDESHAKSVSLMQSLRRPLVTIIPASDSLFEQGARLYIDRPDKGWSLTDCISFVVMEREGLLEALTADHHFEQAGFIALLK